MEVLDQVAVEHDDASTTSGRVGVRRDDPTRPVHLARCRPAAVHMRDGSSAFLLQKVRRLTLPSRMTPFTAPANFDWHIRGKWTIVACVARQWPESVETLARSVADAALHSCARAIADPSAAAPLLVPPASTSRRRGRAEGVGRLLGREEVPGQPIKLYALLDCPTTLLGADVAARAGAARPSRNCQCHLRARRAACCPVRRAPRRGA